MKGTNTTKDGGPAHPRVGLYDNPRQAHPGMSLRDYFAGQALAGLQLNFETTCETDAKLAYALADAMLAERDKP